MKRNVESITLDKGSHSHPDTGMCAMEAVAWLAGEPHTDHPMCACRALGEYVRALNDAMGDEQRQRLKQFVPQIVGTYNTLSTPRSHVLAWAAVSVYAPIALDAIGLADHAEPLRALPLYAWTAAETLLAAAVEAAGAEPQPDGVREAATKACEAAASAAAAAEWYAVVAARAAAEAAAEAALAAGRAVSQALATATREARDTVAGAEVWGHALAALQRALAVTHA